MTTIEPTYTPISPERMRELLSGIGMYPGAEGEKKARREAKYFREQLCQHAAKLNGADLLALFMIAVTLENRRPPKTRKAR